MRTCIVGLILASVQLFSHADVISVYRAGEEDLTLSYRDDQHIRVDRTNGVYTLINGTKAVGVLRQSGNSIVLDADQMAGMLSSVNTGQPVVIPDSKDVKLTDTGIYREVAGYKGKVFEISDGKGVYRVVLTDHPRVIAASDAFRHFLRRFASAMGDEHGARILALDTAFRDYPYRGLLQVDNGVTLVSLTEAPRPDDFYQIPKTTLNLSLPGLLK